MILLFDQNLSFRLTRALADIYPGALHVKHLGLTRATMVIVEVNHPKSGVGWFKEGIGQSISKKAGS